MAPFSISKRETHSISSSGEFAVFQSQTRSRQNSGGRKQEEKRRATCSQAEPPFRACVLILSSDRVACRRRAEVEWRFTHLSACCRQGTSGHRGFSKAVLGTRPQSPDGGLPRQGWQALFLNHHISFIYCVFVCARHGHRQGMCSS